MGTILPPRPRADLALRDVVRHRLESLPSGTLHWDHCANPDASLAWVGMTSPELPLARDWVWDVVAPDGAQYAAEPHELLLVVPQDSVLVGAWHPSNGRPVMQLQVSVRSVPDEVDLPADALPEPPWHLELTTGWSKAALIAAANRWIVKQTGRDDVTLESDAPPSDATSEPESYALGQDLQASSAVLDQLLMLPPATAAQLSYAFGAVVEALAPWR